MLNPTNLAHDKIIIISFAGREKYLETQRHFLLDLLSENERIELHLWNFSRNSSDNEYLQTLSKSSHKINIFNQHYEGANNIEHCIKKVGTICPCKKCRIGKWTEPYKFYSLNESFKNSLFVKLDDDIVFIETKKFDKFVDQLRAHPGIILSANVINNGLCAMANDNQRTKIEAMKLLHEPDEKKPRVGPLMKAKKFFSRFSKKDPAALMWWRLCVSADFFRFTHNYFFTHTEELLGQPMKLIPLPKSRFSINTIGFDWQVMRKIHKKIGNEQSMNDEAIISKHFNILMCRGFLTAHLHFADQRALISDDEEAMILKKYNSIARTYLEN